MDTPALVYGKWYFMSTAVYGYVSKAKVYGAQENWFMFKKTVDCIYERKWNHINLLNSDVYPILHTTIPTLRYYL